MAIGQEKTHEYPSDVFQFPLNPNQQNFLSGTMGELRGNHFHSGIDIKTYGKTGLPIYAIADGYVSRVRVSPYGYGKALYVTHPKIGYTSVYAHCKKFNSKINSYVQKKQYEKKSFAVGLHPTSDMFPVKKGDIIAYSGNTGGSFGPHLHFEIRDIFQNVLNPLFFKFDEVKDNIPPSILKLKLVPLEINSRINGKFESVTIDVKSKGNGIYYLSETPKVNGKIGVQVKTYDQLNGASNKNGVSSYQFYYDKKLEYEFFMESFAFDETRYLNRHVDYAEHHNHSDWLQKSYLDDGNKLDLYKYNSNKGVINVNDDSKHTIEIKVKDAYGNESQLAFNVQGVTNNVISRNPSITSGASKILYSTFDNTLIVTAYNNPVHQKNCDLYFNGKEKKVDLAYITSNQAIYLWDLRNGLPDSVVIGGLKTKFNFKIVVPSQQKMTVYDSDVNIHFQRSALYDTLYLEIEKNDKGYSINDMTIPLFSYIHVTLKPKEQIINKAKSRVYSYDKKGHLIYEGGTWTNNQINFKTRSLGTFTIEVDDEKPKISRLRDNGNSVRFKIQDNLSGVDTYYATIDNEFLLMNYNYKTGVIWSERIDESKPIKGELKLVVTDNVGNTNIYKRKIE